MRIRTHILRAQIPLLKGPTCRGTPSYIICRDHARYNLYPGVSPELVLLSQKFIQTYQWAYNLTYP